MAQQIINMKSTNVVLVVAVAALSMSLINKPEVDNSEVINTAEDMIEWIIEDEASGNVGREQADTYIDNLEEIIEELK
jgi:hypothetical protein